MAEKFDGSCSDLAFMKNMTSEIIGKFCTEAYEFTKEKIRLKFMADIAVVYKFLNKLLAQIAILKGIATYNVMIPAKKKWIISGNKNFRFVL